MGYWFKTRNIRNNEMEIQYQVNRSIKNRIILNFFLVLHKPILERENTAAIIVNLAFLFIKNKNDPFL
jgi:hypothetical protein